MINNLDLIEYKEPALTPGDVFEPAFFESDPPLESPPFQKRGKHDVIERILDEKIKSSRSQNCYRYLVH